MSFTPIDILRTQEATQLKHMENHRTQYTHDQLGKNFQNMIQQESKKPTQPTKSDNKEYRYDAKEKGNNQYQDSQGKKKNKGKADKESNKQNKTGGIDLLI